MSSVVPLPIRIRSVSGLQNPRIKSVLTNWMPPVPAGTYGTVRAIVCATSHSTQNGKVHRTTKPYSHVLLESRLGMDILPSDGTFAALRERINPFMKEMKLTSLCYEISSGKDGELPEDTNEHPEYFIGIPGALIQIPMLGKEEFLAHLKDLEHGKNIAPHSHIMHVHRATAHRSKLMENFVAKEAFKRLRMIDRAFLPKGYRWEPKMLQDEQS